MVSYLRILPLFFLIIMAFLSCSSNENSVTEEHKIKEIFLNGDASLREAELSGLTWYKDNLILLPQYPFNFDSTGNGKIFSIPKKRILDFIYDGDTTFITPQEISFVADGLEEFNNYGSGYEAIVFNGDNVYLTIESMIDSSMMGYVVKGVVDWGKMQIILDSLTLTQIKPQTNIHNITDESIIFHNNQIITIHEVNGKKVNTNPNIHFFDTDLNLIEKQHFPNIEYRITDATIPDNLGKFWVINYYYPGKEEKQLKANDPEFEKYGKGLTHRQSDYVERLLELQITNKAIIRTETPPIQIKLNLNSDGRNWEGVVKLENHGFLLVSDYFPRTILSFIKIN